MNNNVVFFLKCVVLTQLMIAFCNFDPINAKINHFDRFKLFRKVKNESQTQENIYRSEGFLFEPNSLGGFHVLFWHGFVFCHLGQPNSGY